MKIKAYVRMDEVNKVHYYRNFEVIDFMPKVGDLCFGEEIKEIIPVSIDVEQGSFDAFDYDYFHVLTTQNNEYDKANDVYREQWYAIERPILREELHYWLETEYYFGDFSIPKFALHKVTENEDGEENDEIVLYEAYNDVPEMPEDENDFKGRWAAIDSFIEKELGFLPEYEVN